MGLSKISTKSPRVLLCIVALGTMAAVCPEGLSAATPESYPAVYAEPLPDSGTAGLQALYVRTEAGLMLDSLHPTCRPLPRPSTSWAWYKVGPHPLLSNLAAGASFYIVVRGNKDRRDIGDGEEWELLVAVYKDRTYLMPRDMAQLLHDAGMEFRKSDAQSWARFGAVIYAWTVRSIVERWSARERELPEFGLRRPVFPALTIESNVPDTLSGDAFVGWPEYLVVGGQRETLFVLAVRQRLHSPVEGDSFVGILPVMFKPNRVGTDIDVYYPRSDATDEDVRFGFKLPNPCLYTDSLGGTRLPGTQAKVIDARESCQHA